MKKLPESAGWMGDRSRGAALGRLNSGPRLNAQYEGAIKFSLQRVRLDAGGYDSGGAYWGHHKKLYWASSDCGTFERFFRASDRDAARETIRAEFPNAKFYR